MHESWRLSTGDVKINGAGVLDLGNDLGYRGFLSWLPRSDRLGLGTEEENGLVTKPSLVTGSVTSLGTPVDLGNPYLLGNRVGYQPGGERVYRTFDRHHGRLVYAI